MKKTLLVLVASLALVTVLALGTAYAAEKVYITTYSKKEVTLVREGMDQAHRFITLKPGAPMDFWQMHGDFWLESPNRSESFHPDEGDRYIIFEDNTGTTRIAYIGKDGSVKPLAR